MGELCRSKQREYEDKGMHCRRTCVPDSLLRRGREMNAECSDAKRIKPSVDADVYTRNIAYFRSHYTNKNMPKCVLNVHAMKHCLDQPTYITRQEDRLFQTVITFQDKKYASSYWEKNKRFAEQGAALVCLLGLGLVSESDLTKDGSLTK